MRRAVADWSKLTAAASSDLPETVVSIRDAAWLCRVNDDTVRSWLTRGLAGSKAGGVVYSDLRRWAQIRGTAVLPLAALATPPEAWPAGPEPERPEASDSSAEENGTASESRERALRITIRELVNAAVHGRSELAARDRAITALLDAFERETGYSQSGLFDTDD